MHRFVIFDMSAKKISAEEYKSIVLGVHHERNNQWGKFNTVNRADTTRILNNLANMAIYEQTSILHSQFSGRAAIIVSPGPSLEKNIELLKDVKGRAVIICVLHALRDLQISGVDPDIVVHVDPRDLKTVNSKKNGKVKSLWNQWIDGNDLSKVNLVVSNYQRPNMFEVSAKNVIWMSSGLPIGELLPIDVFDYERVGGSVSHAAFDLAVELGCTSIALVGQDLAFSKDGANYTKHADLGEISKDKRAEKLKAYGDDVETKGWNNQNVISNNTFIAFGKAFESFARELNGKDIALFNCSEGGLYIEGFEHCKLSTFIENQVSNDIEKNVADLLIKCKSTPEQNQIRIKETIKFIMKNRILAQEIRELINNLFRIVEKPFHDDNDLRKFDKLQRRMIKKMSKNKFYSLGLQRDIHILTSGLRADPSVDGQLGFHSDFLRVSRDLNKDLSNS